jgi:hypothetical protein
VHCHHTVSQCIAYYGLSLFWWLGIVRLGALRRDWVQILPYEPLLFGAQILKHKLSYFEPRYLDSETVILDGFLNCTVQSRLGEDGDAIVVRGFRLMRCSLWSNAARGCGREWNWNVVFGQSTLTLVEAVSGRASPFLARRCSPSSPSWIASPAHAKDELRRPQKHSLQFDGEPSVSPTSRDHGR